MNDQQQKPEPDPPYNGEDDFGKSIEVAYQAVRERVASGGPSWKPKPPRQHNHMTNPWTEEREAKLRELWPGDTGCKQIAELLGGGISKNSVIGKARRLKLDARAIVVNGIKVFRNRKPVDVAARRPRPTPEQRIERRRASNRIYMARKRAKGSEENMQQPIIDPRLEPAPVYADSRNMRFEELEYGLCKFATTPHDAGPLEHRFCGQKAYELSPYCRYHHAVAGMPRPAARAR